MSKQSIKWHEECLKAQYVTLKRKREELERITNEVNRLEGETIFYQVQIFNAKDQGKESFDNERYMQNVKHHYLKGE